MRMLSKSACDNAAEKTCCGRTTVSRVARGCAQNRLAAEGRCEAATVPAQIPGLVRSDLLDCHTGRRFRCGLSAQSHALLPRVQPGRPPIPAPLLTSRSVGRTPRRAPCELFAQS